MTEQDERDILKAVLKHHHGPLITIVVMLWMTAIFIGTPAIIIGLAAGSVVATRVGIALYIWALLTFLIALHTMRPTMRKVDAVLEFIRDRETDA